MVGIEPEDASHAALFHQQWRDVSFVHWPVEPNIIGRLLPTGLRPDVLDGRAWVTLTPFAVRRERPAGLPPLPRVSNYGEVNVRTYVVGPDGRDGIWFFSLDVGSPLPVAAARTALGAPYHLAHVHIEHVDDRVGYRGRRRGKRRTAFDMEIAVGASLLQPTAQDVWLTGRWRAWTKTAGPLVCVPVTHGLWPLHAAAVERLDETLTVAASVPGPPPDCVAHYARGVDARFGRPETARGAA